MMESEFQMSMMGKQTFFLGIQVKQTKQGTFVHQAKSTKDLMKKFNMTELKLVSTLRPRLVQMKMVRLWTRESTGA
jgi:hypothetical protein